MLCDYLLLQNPNIEYIISLKNLLFVVNSACLCVFYYNGKRVVSIALKLCMNKMLPESQSTFFSLFQPSLPVFWLSLIGVKLNRSIGMLKSLQLNDGLLHCKDMDAVLSTWEFHHKYSQWWSCEKVWYQSVQSLSVHLLFAFYIIGVQNWVTSSNLHVSF